VNRLHIEVTITVPPDAPNDDLQAWSDWARDKIIERAMREAEKVGLSFSSSAGTSRDGKATRAWEFVDEPNTIHR
jgi:hypothetical protein